MQATGIVRHVDELGRIVLPIEVRRRLELNAKDGVEIFMESDRVILMKHSPCCVFCGDAGDIVPFKNKKVCRKCLEAIKEGKAE